MSPANTWGPNRNSFVVFAALTHERLKNTEGGSVGVFKSRNITVLGRGFFAIDALAYAVLCAAIDS